MWGWTDGESEDGRAAEDRPGVKRKGGRRDTHRFVISVQFAAVNVSAAF
jgi:hypothetical protein